MLCGRFRYSTAMECIMCCVSAGYVVHHVAVVSMHVWCCLLGGLLDIGVYPLSFAVDFVGGGRAPDEIKVC